LVLLIWPFDCADKPDLTDHFNTALTELLASAAITTPIQISAADDSNFVISAQCQGEQAIYTIKLLVDDEFSSSVADPESLSLTWKREELDLPALIAAATVAYQAGKPEHTVPWLDKAAKVWDQIPPAEKAGLKLLQGKPCLSIQTL
jgi:hypothetical protein